MKKLACFRVLIMFLLLADLLKELGVVIFSQERIGAKATLAFVVVTGFSFIVIFVCRPRVFY